MNTIPTPRDARANQQHAKDTRIKAACDILRPKVAEAMNAGQTSVSLHAVLSGEAQQLGMTSSTRSSTLPDHYMDVANDAAKVLIAEIKAAGWCEVCLYGGDIRWSEPPTCAPAETP